MNSMKNNVSKTAALVLLLAFSSYAQAQTDSAKKTLALTVAYYMQNNKVIYLLASAKTKTDGKFLPVKGISMSVYLDKDSSGNLIGKIITNERGLAKAIIPPALKTAWNGLAKHSFIAVSETNKDFESTTAETAMAKSRIVIDTVFDGEKRSIKVTVSSFNGTGWVPAANVEMKVGIGRSAGSILSAEKETYTTDSTGTVTAELTRINIPGGEKGNIVLVAKVEENDQYGNLIVEKTVPWGVAVKPDNSFFDQRALWATRFRTPFWLLFMAYSIVIGVWGTLCYLVLQIFKIKRLGNAEPA
jgi:hypothetical protein